MTACLTWAGSVNCRELLLAVCLATGGAGGVYCCRFTQTASKLFQKALEHAATLHAPLSSRRVWAIIGGTFAWLVGGALGALYGAMAVTVATAVAELSVPDLKVRSLSVWWMGFQR